MLIDQTLVIYFVTFLSLSAHRSNIVIDTENRSFLLCIASGAAMMEALASKTTAWEKERGVGFNYDGVSNVF